MRPQVIAFRGFTRSNIANRLLSTEYRILCMFQLVIAALINRDLFATTINGADAERHFFEIGFPETRFR